MDSSRGGQSQASSNVDLWLLPSARERQSQRSRSAVRRVIGNYIGDSFDERIATTPAGKPYLSGSRWHFSVSHTHESLLVAVSYDRPVGIDFERVVELPDVERMIQTYCAFDERAELANVPSGQRSTCFLQRWVRKEALAKATGVGIASSIALADIPSAIGPARFDGRSWLVQDVDVGPGYVGAIARFGECRYGVVQRDPRILGSIMSE